MHKRFLSALVLASVASMSQAAITFSNFVYGSGAVTAGFPTTASISGNSITWQPANAQVGDGLAIRILPIALQYDAKSTGAAINAVLGSVGSTTQGFVFGSGVIRFQEDVFELDALGNEVAGGPIGTVVTDTTATGSLPSTTINLSRVVSSIRVKKSFLLSALPDTAGFDYAGISQVNQSVGVVPEPASMAALGLGVAAMLRRRKRA